MRGLLGPSVKLTIFLVVTGFVTYLLGATITNATYGPTTTYRALFTDATGLLAGDDVRIAGVRVGSIRSIDLVQPRTGGASLAEVTFTVTRSRPLPASAIAELRFRNLVGQRYLAIEEGAGSNQPQPPKAPIPLSQTQNALDLTVLFAGFKPLFQGLDASEINSLSMEIIQTLQGEGGTVTLLLQQTADLTTPIADKDKVIGDLIDNLCSVLDTVGQRDAELNNLIIQLQRWVVRARAGPQGDRRLPHRHQRPHRRHRLRCCRRSGRSAQAGRQRHDRRWQRPSTPAARTINGVLQRLPNKVATLTRTATYGSWFNFFLCNAGGTVTLPVIGKQPVGMPSSPPSRCS